MPWLKYAVKMRSAEWGQTQGWNMAHAHNMKTVSEVNEYAWACAKMHLQYRSDQMFFVRTMQSTICVHLHWERLLSLPSCPIHDACTNQPM
jgi:hypothetical protein